MNNKKKWFVGVILVSCVFFISLSSVSAAYLGTGSIRYFIEGIINAWVDFFEPILGVLFGGSMWSGSLLFEKFLIFVLLASLINVILSRTPLFDGGGHKSVRIILSIVVPLIGIRYIDYEWMNTILFQYKVLGITISAVFPLVIFFFFVTGITDNGVMRKVLWIFFIVIYFGLWATSKEQVYGSVYLWVIIISLFFLFFDGTIQRYYLKERIKAAGRDTVWQRIIHVENDIKRINASNIPPDVKDKMRQSRYTELEKLRKYL